MEEINLSNLAKHFSDEDSAQVFLEQILWPNGPVCPHCGSQKVYTLELGTKAYKEGPENKRTRSRKALKVWQCKDCRKQFTVTVGTIFEDSHIPLNKWLLAFHLLCSSKKGMSSHQLMRMLGLGSYKTALFMTHRIRYAMSQPPLLNRLRGIVEADETYIGGKAHGKRGRGAENKIPVLTLVERNGRARSTKVANVTGQTLKGIIKAQVDKTAIMMTDSFGAYNGLAKDFADHQTVDHGAKEYVRGLAHVNTAEGFFSILKRGIDGVYHHVSEQHLHRYLSEFDFRYNERKVEDGERTVKAIEGTKGKRLMYKAPLAGSYTI